MEETLKQILEELKKIEKNTRKRPIIRTRIREGLMGDNDFTEFYKKYPRKEGKQAGYLKFMKLNKKLLPLMEKSLKHLEGKEKKYIPYFSTWVSQKRWEDEPEFSKSEMSSDQLKESLDDFIKKKSFELKQKTGLEPDNDDLDSWIDLFYKN